MNGRSSFLKLRGLVPQFLDFSLDNMRGNPIDTVQYRFCISRSGFQVVIMRHIDVRVLTEVTI